MKTEANKRVIGYFLAICVMGLLTGSAANAATVDSLASVFTPVDYGSVTFQNAPAGTVKVRFGSVWMPEPGREVTIWADGTPESPFGGDYTVNGANITKLSFRIAGSGVLPQTAAVLFIGKSGTRWNYPGVVISADSGVATMNEVALDPAAGWKTDAVGDRQKLWSSDLQDVKSIGIQIVPTPSEQSYTIDQFKLMNADGSSQYAPIFAEQALRFFKAKYGITYMSEVTAAMKNADSDGDGMSDWDEVMCGTDPESANSIFAAEIVSAGADGLTIQWPCVADVKYRVLKRSGSMDANAEAVVFGRGASANEIAMGMMTYTDTLATGDGPYFYQVVKE